MDDFTGKVVKTRTLPAQQFFARDSWCAASRSLVPQVLALVLDANLGSLLGGQAPSRAWREGLGAPPKLLLPGWGFFSTPRRTNLYRPATARPLTGFSTARKCTCTRCTPTVRRHRTTASRTRCCRPPAD